ncbi:unnamed protein product [Brachionus calyciflorus]|uniref:Uncharacterized protein n=1 Tax=Brachionus calyciflorus TaxID=104777 RepID=A0A814L6D9_9BILA|nr:unnamed protein product [Brachionus calyciflorus]
MSLSDFSISSPRKSRIGDRSLTNDEDFENFLNDETSESEFSSNKFKKQAKPWWMNDDDDKPGKTSTSFNSTKSFVKKPKPEIPKLQPTYESNENDDNDKPLETNRYTEDFDDEISKKSSLSIKSRKSQEKNESHIQQSIHEFDEESSEQITSSHKSLPSVIQRKTTEKPLEATTPNLLSKVMFIDSLESSALGTQTLKQLQQETLRKNESLNEHNQTSKLNTQTRRDLADLEIVYRNLTTHTDSGLNTMIRANTANDQFDDHDNNSIKVKDIRIEYEKQLNDLRAKLNDVTNQVN